MWCAAVAAASLVLSRSRFGGWAAHATALGVGNLGSQAFMRPRKCAKAGAPHVLQYQSTSEDGTVHMKCKGCRYAESSRPSS